MSDHVVRVLDTDEHRQAAALFAATIHLPPPTDERWERAAAAKQPGRVLGAFDDELIGTARSTDTTLVVRGDTAVPNAAVSDVGVRSDRTRRGVMTDLMRTQLTDFAGRGVVTANLHASEGAIYGRYGYGPATYARDCRVDRHRAVLRGDLPAVGEVNRLGPDEARSLLPGVHAALPRDRAGMLGRAPESWEGFWAFLSRSESPIITVAHRGRAGLDGFAVYEVNRRGETTELTVHDLHAGTSQALVGLWRYLLGVDLVDVIEARARPLDEPAALLFTDPRVYRTDDVYDETWLRLVDVPAALEAMRRDGDPIVLEVHDPMIEANSGRYLVSPDTVDRTDEPADLRMNVGELAMAYFGAWRPSALASFGRVSYLADDALSAADRMFTSHHAPWCGTFF